MPWPAMGSWRHAAHVCGFPIEPVLSESGVGVFDPHRPLRVTPLCLLQAFSACVAQSRDQHFPFVLGDVFNFEHFPEFDKFLSSCSTLREMLEMASWARDLLVPWLTLHLDEVGAEAHLRIDMTFQEFDPQAMRHVREAAMSAINQLVRRSLNGSNWLLSVRVASQAPEYQKQFADHFGASVYFGEGADALVMDRRLLDIPFNTFVPEAYSQARQLLARRMTREVGERPIIDDVRWAMERRPDLLRQGLDATAQALNLHPRTLQRRLQSEGVKYVDVQSLVKCHRAHMMLRRRAISMEVISAELGFSDRRAFTFAFKRWTGQSPSGYRDQLGMSGR